MRKFMLACTGTLRLAGMFSLLQLLFICFPESPLANTIIPPIILKGRVAGNDGDALQGVSVTFTGTSKGTSTGTDGRFSIESDGNAQTLVFSFVGFEARRVVQNQLY